MSPPVVVNTRPREQAAELSQLLRAAGFEPLELPAIEIISAPFDSKPFLDRLRDGAYAWVVLPSQNAARFFPESLQYRPVLCGRATAQALGIQDASTLEPFGAAAALEWLAPRLRPGDRVLMPRAAEGRDELEHGLRSLGVVVDAPVCYRTVPASSFEGFEARLRAGAVAAVTFCSPSAVRASSVDLRDTKVVCLGRTTADAARASGLNVDAVADSTSMPSLVNAVRRALEGVAV